MKTKNWKAFPHDASDFLYDGDALKKNWKRLHEGDNEPFPDVKRMKSLMGDGESAAEALQQAWRDFHHGDFASAVDRGMELGAAGAAVANKAAGMYATYLEPSESNQLKIFEAIAENAEAAMDALPNEPASHYFHAFALGRYSQGISIVKALSQGLGGKIKDSLDRTLALDDKHAEAHTAMGLYHAEIIDKVGGMVGKLTYGANPKKAMAHFEAALNLAPHSPIARIEYGNGLLMLFKNKKIDDATDAYVEASEMTPADAMQKLDVELALSEFE